VTLCSGVTNPITPVTWLKRGRQRRAVAQVLRRPLTVSQIRKEAVAFAPKIQLRDVWFILRQLEARGLVQCFNPTLLNGKLFFWTEAGQAVAGSAFGYRIDSPTVTDLDWNSYGRVVRAPVRRTVLEEISRLPQAGKCIAEIRRQLRDKKPMQLSRTIRAVKELSGMKLIRQAGHTSKPKRKLYELTPAGRTIAEALRQHKEPGAIPRDRNPRPPSDDQVCSFSCLGEPPSPS